MHVPVVYRAAFRLKFDYRGVLFLGKECEIVGARKLKVDDAD